ncbi:MAG: DUF1080 domain-containing protein [Imperialibacter sp.]|uniref:3-keto-disaccharide hydrolase n=1 Tax=Imperialibacter sp. TaxID=2038411 RepID=UPI0032EAB725
MNILKYKAFTATLLVIAYSCSSPQKQAEQVTETQQPEWKQLFNGKDLEGWIPKISGHPVNDNFGNTFRVEDGLLTVAYDQYDSFRYQYGHLFYKEEFSKYIIATEYRFVGEQATGGEGWAERNSGIMVHGQDPATMTVEQDFPISIEVQLLGGLGSGKRPTANLCTPGTHVFLGDSLFTDHCINSTSPTFDGEVWVRVETLVLGDSLIRHYVNGVNVLEYTRPQVGGGVVNRFYPAAKQDGMPLTEGWISLQSESHPIQFRKVELMNLEGMEVPEGYRK